MCTDAEEKAGLYWRGRKEDRDARGAASWHQVKRLRISNIEALGKNLEMCFFFVLFFLNEFPGDAGPGITL